MWTLSGKNRVSFPSAKWLFLPPPKQTLMSKIIIIITYRKRVYNIAQNFYRSGLEAKLTIVAVWRVSTLPAVCKTSYAIFTKHLMQPWTAAVLHNIKVLTVFRSYWQNDNRILLLHGRVVKAFALKADGSSLVLGRVIAKTFNMASVASLAKTRQISA